jgi:hypothetical protein
MGNGGIIKRTRCQERWFMGNGGIINGTPTPVALKMIRGNIIVETMQLV